MLSGIDDPKMGEVQALKGLVHGFGDFRGFAEFTFNRVSPAPHNKEKINLSAAMGGPVKRLGRFNYSQYLLNGKTFP